MNPICGLLTDFGAGSGYPGQMKARLCALAPGTAIVDIGHEVPPFDVAAGAVLLEEAAAAFPPGAVIVAVVDPGVGTARRGLLVEGGRRAPKIRFVGPDNGLLARVAEGGRAWALPPPSPEAAPTFHGRDVFVPAAARLLRGFRPARLGAPAGPIVPSPIPAPRARGRAVIGRTILADRFGNLLTNVGREHLPAGALRVRLAGRPVPVVRTFGEARRGTAVAYVGSGGRLELGVVEGSLAARLGRDALGARVEVLPEGGGPGSRRRGDGRRRGRGAILAP